MQRQPVVAVLPFQSNFPSVELQTKKFIRQIPVSHPGLIAIDLLSASCPELTRAQLKKAMTFGAVWLSRGVSTRRLRRFKQVLEPGMSLHLYYDAAILEQEPLQAKLVADEGVYSVWHKPCGMFSQGTKWGDHSAICRWVEMFGLKNNALPDRQAFMVHRLDRATSGLILLAHQKKVAAKLAALFENRLVDKRYRAVVHGKFPSSLTTLDAEIDGKVALSRVLQVEYLAECARSIVTIKLETGRKHQIRKHLASVGFPILGDRLYGGDNSGDNSDNKPCDMSDKKSDEANKPVSSDDNDESLPDLQLQSFYLAFQCPLSGEEKVFQL